MDRLKCMTKLGPILSQARSKLWFEREFKSSLVHSEPSPVEDQFKPAMAQLKTERGKAHRIHSIHRFGHGCTQPKYRLLQRKVGSNIFTHLTFVSCEGSGIAEAKATLNGVITPNCTSLLTALCKGLSVIMSVSASLPAGLEGVFFQLVCSDG